MKIIKIPAFFAAAILLLFQTVSAQTIFEHIEKSDLEKIKQVIKENPELLNEKDPESGGSLLHHAAYHGKPEMTVFFKDSGIDVHVKDNNGYTPFVWAVFGKSISTMDLLLKYGAEISPPARRGRSILHLAASNGTPEIIEYLLKKGVDVNAKSTYGNTPLFWALRQKKYDNAKTLIENGADLLAANKEGYTPVSLAVNNNDIKMVEMFLQYGIDLKKQDGAGDTYLHTAVYNGLKEMTELLLEKGAGADAVNNQGRTALDMAVIRGHSDIQELLESKGAKLTGIKMKDKPVKFEKPGPGLDKPFKIKIIYDNYVYKEGMEADWGFSCFIEGTEKNILFDTGTRSGLFQKNLSEMNIDPMTVDAVVISHEHGDHTGGMSSFLEKNNKPPVMVPFSLPYNLIRLAESKGAEVLALKEPVEVCKDVYLSGEMGTRIKEHSLAVNTPKGLVVVCGCSHPGIVKIVKHFKELLKKDVYFVLGGFHLMNKTETEMQEIIAEMKNLGVQKCGASHCTGEKQIQIFKEAFGEDYIALGVGREIEL